MASATIEDLAQLRTLQHLTESLKYAADIIHHHHSLEREGKAGMCVTREEKLTAHEVLLSYLDRDGIRHRGRSIEELVKDATAAGRHVPLYTDLANQWDDYKSYLHGENWDTIRAEAPVSPNRYRETIARITFETAWTNEYWMRIRPQRQVASRFYILVPPSVALRPTVNDHEPAGPRGRTWSAATVMPGTLIPSGAPVSELHKYLETWSKVQLLAAVAALCDHRYHTVAEKLLAKTSATLLSMRENFRTAISADDDMPQREAFRQWMMHGDPHALFNRTCLDEVKRMADVFKAHPDQKKSIAMALVSMAEFKAHVKSVAASEDKILSDPELGKTICAAYRNKCLSRLSHALCAGLVSIHNQFGEALNIDARPPACIECIDNHLIEYGKIIRESMCAMENLMTKVNKQTRDNEANWRAAYSRLMTTSLQRDRANFQMALASQIESMAKTYADQMTAAGVNASTAQMLDATGMDMIRKTLGAMISAGTELKAGTYTVDNAMIELDVMMKRVEERDLADERAKLGAMLDRVIVKHRDALLRCRAANENQRLQNESWRGHFSDSISKEWNKWTVRNVLLAPFKSMLPAAATQMEHIPCGDSMPMRTEWIQGTRALSAFRTDVSGGISLNEFLRMVEPLVQIAHAYDVSIV